MTQWPSCLLATIRVFLSNFEQTKSKFQIVSDSFRFSMLTSVKMILLKWEAKFVRSCPVDWHRAAEDGRHCCPEVVKPIRLGRLLFLQRGSTVELYIYKGNIRKLKRFKVFDLFLNMESMGLHDGFPWVNQRLRGSSEYFRNHLDLLLFGQTSTKASNLLLCNYRTSRQYGVSMLWMTWWRKK